MNKKTIKRRYKAINLEHGSTGRNFYRCPKGHYTLTIHKDRGVTPMMITCPCADCDLTASSMFYNVPQEGSHEVPGHPDRFPDHVEYWVRPSLEWCLKPFRRGIIASIILEHVLMGGLLFESQVNEKH